jgi:SAM-dependent methyltransferase
VPALYDRYRGPVFFEPFARDLADCVADLRTGNLLEIAAGTGIVTRVLARVLPEAVSIVASDINQAMLDFAAAQPGLARISWRQADALALPFDDAAFDAVLCQFGVMFFRDRVVGYREARRVLKPGGRFVFDVWDRIENNEFCRIVTDAMARLFPNNPPGLLARVPYGYFDTDLIRDELTQAGFDKIAIETVSRQSAAPLARDLAIGFCKGSPTVTLGAAPRRGSLPMSGSDEARLKHEILARYKKFVNSTAPGCTGSERPVILPVVNGSLVKRP